jgi:putative SOS response-associated peptidase YedK
MLAHGFRREILAGLVLAELATVVTRTMRAGGRPINVDHYVITDDGREALGGS